MSELTVDEELEASRRTVEVLKAKVHSMHNGPPSMIHKQLEAARRRDEKNANKRALLLVREAELTRHNRALEDEVARRTRCMKRVLDSVQFGFLVVDRDLIVQPESTQSCLRLFARQSIEGVCLLDALGLVEDARMIYQLATDQLFEDVLPEAASLAQLPTSVRMGTRTLHVEASVLRAAEGLVEALLFTVSDMTALVEAHRESAENRMLLMILRCKASFVAFLDDVKVLLTRAYEALEEGDSPRLCRAVHTIKGNSMTYDLAEIAAIVHAVEGRGIDAAGLEEIAQGFAGFLKKHDAILQLGSDASDTTIFQLSAKQVTSLRRLAHEIGNDELDIIAEAVAERPAGQILGPIDVFASRLAERLGKTVQFEVRGDDTAMDDQRMRPVIQNVVHLVRNAIDHGIEVPDSRGPKPGSGKIEVAFRADPAGYYIEVSDDGAGIDTECVATRAIERGHLSRADIEAMSHEARLGLIFLDGVSSKGEATDISGRGIGMSAVRAAVDAANGTLAVRSVHGEGTCVSITVPRATSYRREPQRPARTSSLAPQGGHAPIHATNG
jgi:signal transduction histidine kinase